MTPSRNTEVSHTVRKRTKTRPVALHGDEIDKLVSLTTCSKCPPFMSGAHVEAPERRVCFPPPPVTLTDLFARVTKKPRLRDLSLVALGGWDLCMTGLVGKLSRELDSGSPGLGPAHLRQEKALFDPGAEEAESPPLEAGWARGVPSGVGLESLALSLGLWKRDASARRRAGKTAGYRSRWDWARRWKRKRMIDADKEV